MPADSPHPPRPIVRGRRFATPNPEAVHHSFADAARWMASRRPGAWPRTVDVTPTVPRARVGPGELVATWVGHTTVLVQVDGVNVLTDPIWSARCSPVQWAGPKRVAAPGVRLDDLPPIDVVVISHDHYDHLDAATVKQLAAAHPECTFVVPMGVDRRLRGWGIDHCIAATWWDACEVAGLRITCTPAQHFSGRTAFDRDTTLWATWMLEPKQGGAVWFGGDTGWFDAGFRAIGDAFDDVRLALIPIGAFAPRWFMSPVHIDPQQAVDLARIVGARAVLATHHRTFPLADDGYDQPADELAAALADADEPDGWFRVLAHGEVWDVSV